jgi:hypothetical protein
VSRSSFLFRPRKTSSTGGQGRFVACICERGAGFGVPEVRIKQESQDASGVLTLQYPPAGLAPAVFHFPGTRTALLSPRILRRADPGLYLARLPRCWPSRMCLFSPRVEACGTPEQGSKIAPHSCIESLQAVWHSGSLCGTYRSPRAAESVASRLFVA